MAKCYQIDSILKTVIAHSAQGIHEYCPYRARACSKATTSSSGVAQEVPMRAR